MTDLKHYRVGFIKSGEVKPARTKPKRRLSEYEARILRILQMYKANDPETSLSMLDILAKYRDIWPDDVKYYQGLCSDNLRKLQQNLFVKMVPARNATVNKATEAIRPTRKAKFYLSEIAKSDEITIDSYNWVILYGKYIATEKYRDRTKKNLTSDKIER